MQHLEEGTIHAWLDGALPAEESAGVERHVAECAECASLVAEARGMIAGASRIVASLDVVPGGVIPKSSATKKASGSLWRTLRFTPSRAALAATLVIAVSSVLTLRHDTPEKIVPKIPSKTTAPAPIASSPPPGAPIAAKDEVSGRREIKAPAAPPAAARQAPSSRRDVADARTQIADSMRSEPRSKPVAEVAAANRADAQRAAAIPQISLAKANPDSVRTTSERRADSLSRFRAAAVSQGFAAQKADAAARVREATDLLARSTDPVIACYQLTDSATNDKTLPARFALDLDRGDPNAHIVRALSADGVADTIIGRASWERRSETTIDVRLPSGEKALLLVMKFPTGSVTGVATIRGEGAERTAAITRLSCRR